MTFRLSRFILALALFLAPVNASAQQRGYDAQRMSDILTISDMLEAYYGINKHYPLVHEAQIEVINVFIGDDIPSDFPASAPYQMLEAELQEALGGEALLPKDPDDNRLPYIYATDGQRYFVAAFLYHKYPFALEQGRHVNKVEVTNSPRLETKSHKPSYIRHVLKYGADDANKQAELFLALKERRLDEASAILEIGGNLNPTCGFNHRCQPLATASMEGDLEFMRYLIDHGADLDGYNAHDDVPLIYALSNNQIEAAKLLIESGANVNIPNAFGFSPFVGASALGNNELITLMIQKGAKLDENYFLRVGSAKPGDKNMRPLEVAIQYDQPGIVSLLLNSGADPNLQNVQGETITAIGQRSENKAIRQQF